MVLPGFEILVFPSGFPIGVNDKCAEDSKRAMSEST
jgi:hypothetical protein